MAIYQMLIGAFLLALLGATPVWAAEKTKDSAIQVTAKQLTAAYLKNEQTAAKKYGDPTSPKDVEVSGIVEKVVDGSYGKIARLAGEKGVVVSVLMRGEDAEVVKAQQSVAFRGKCRGLFKNEKLVDLNGGVLIPKPEE
jgi:hypothetical protein